MRNHSWALSIDFGTSNTAAAHFNELKSIVEPVGLSHNHFTMSSAAFMLRPEEFLVGDIALNYAESDSRALIRSPKRLVPQLVFEKNGYQVPTAVPVSAIMRAVIDKASKEHDNIPPSSIVLTHPEQWSEREVGVLSEAVVQLGFSESQIFTISEPRAAASYYAQTNQLAPGDCIAVFDFGGGTLDVAVMESGPDGDFTVLSAVGDAAIGGQSFDSILRRWLDSQLNDIAPDLASRLRHESSAGDKQLLMTSIRRAKEILSDSQQATLSVKATPVSKAFQITRSEFEELIEPTVDRAINLTRDALQSAGVLGSERLVAIYLTGGSSRIPLVQEKLKELGPLASLDDPKLVVAQGALSAHMSTGSPLLPAQVDRDYSGDHKLGSVDRDSSAGLNVGITTAAQDWSDIVETDATEEMNSVNSFSSPEPRGVVSVFLGKRMASLLAFIFIVILIASVVVWAILSIGEDSSSRGPAAISDDSSSAPEDFSSQSTSLPTEAPKATGWRFDSSASVRDLVDSIPASLTSGLASCNKNTDGSVGLICDVESDGEWSDYGLTGDVYHTVFFNFEQDYGDDLKLKLRQENINVYNSPSGGLVAGIYTDYFGPNSVTLAFVDEENGLAAEIVALPDRDAAEKMLDEIIVPLTR